jgi:hypothetical protein
MTDFSPLDGGVSDRLATGWVFGSTEALRVACPKSMEKMALAELSKIHADIERIKAGKQNSERAAVREKSSVSPKSTGSTFTSSSDERVMARARVEKWPSSIDGSGPDAALDGCGDKGRQGKKRGLLDRVTVGLLELVGAIDAAAVPEALLCAEVAAPHKSSRQRHGVERAIAILNGIRGSTSGRRRTWSLSYGDGKRFAPRRVETQVECFEINLGKDAIIKFLNEHAQE